jgi:hypothetical protein
MNGVSWLGCERSASFIAVCMGMPKKAKDKLGKAPKPKSKPKKNNVD